MKTLHSNTGVYTRTGQPPIVITNFTPEKLDVSELAAMGILLITDKAMDVVFDTADIAALVPTEPQQHDKFVTEGRTYEVFSLNGNRVGDQISSELFRYITTSRDRIRIHLRQVA